jgi:hypothetical protein
MHWGSRAGQKTAVLHVARCPLVIGVAAASEYPWKTDVRSTVRSLSGDCMLNCRLRGRFIVAVAGAREEIEEMHSCGVLGMAGDVSCDGDLDREDGDSPTDRWRI